MKASEITQPGLYWCQFTDGKCEPVEVFLFSPFPGQCQDRLYFGRFSHDEGWTWDELPDDLAAGDYIGPFPPPGEGPKFEGFKAALDALCRAYGVSLNADYCELFIHNSADYRPDNPLQDARPTDQTKPVTG